MASIDYEDEKPEDYETAVTSPHSKKWMLALQEEYASLMKNETWSLVTLPPVRKPVKNKWVYKLKRGDDGKIQRFKARLVAKGFSQKPGIDYEETFSTVMKHDSLRAILAICAAMDLEMTQLDVTTAFLNGDLEEIFMEQPTGFVKSGHED